MHPWLYKHSPRLNLCPLWDWGTRRADGEWSWTRSPCTSRRSEWRPAPVEARDVVFYRPATPASVHRFIHSTGCSPTIPANLQMVSSLIHSDFPQLAPVLLGLKRQLLLHSQRIFYDLFFKICVFRFIKLSNPMFVIKVLVFQLNFSESTWYSVWEVFGPKVGHLHWDTIIITWNRRTQPHTS